MNSGSDDRNEDHGEQHNEVFDTRDDAPRRLPQLSGLLVVAGIALAGGGAVAYVATHSDNPVRTVSSPGSVQAPAATPSNQPRPWHGRGPGGFGPMGGGFAGGLGFGGLGGVIHGQVTEPKSGGGYQVVDVQRGTVTAVSTSSISVKSADGFSATYAVSSSTNVNAQAAGIGTVKVGDTVALTATVSGGKTTAASIVDLTSIRSSHGAFGFPAGPPPAAPSGPPPSAAPN
jgi:hypothetical protein